MTSDLIYVYCITDSACEPDSITDTEGLKFLLIDGFYVSVKYVPESEFSEENFKRNLSDIQWLETNARAHINVITSIMERSTVIPFKFGTIFAAEAGLRKFVSDYSCSLTENFERIRGKEEWAVKIYCNRKMLGDKIDELSEEAASLEEQIMASSPGKAFLLKRKKSEVVENELNRLCQKYGQQYFEAFNNLSDATRLNNLLPKEFTGREDTMILNSTFFVSKNRVAAFKTAVNMLRNEDGNSSFFIETTGPWPPFSFISIKEKGAG